MYYSNLKRAAAMAVLRLDFDERQEFIESHKYDPSNSNHMVLWNRGKFRDSTLFQYYPITPLITSMNTVLSRTL